MKYQARLKNNPSQNHQTVDFDVRDAMTAHQMKVTEIERKQIVAEKELNDLKNQNPLDFQAIIDKLDEAKLHERDLSILSQLKEELF